MSKYCYVINHHTTVIKINDLPPSSSASEEDIDPFVSKSGWDSYDH